jgi:hypothetical protein
MSLSKHQKSPTAEMDEAIETPQIRRFEKKIRNEEWEGAKLVYNSEGSKITTPYI